MHQGKVRGAATGVNRQEQAASVKLDGARLQRGNRSGFGLRQVNLCRVLRAFDPKAGVSYDGLENVDDFHARPCCGHAEQKRDGHVCPTTTKVPSANLHLDRLLDVAVHFSQVVSRIPLGICRALWGIEQALPLGSGDGGAVNEDLEELAARFARQGLIVVGAHEAP